MPDSELVKRLVADGLLRRDGDVNLHTTGRWQSAMARAALRLLRAGTDGDDLRIPIAAALIELYGDAFDDDALVDAVAVILPVELDELAPLRARP